MERISYITASKKRMLLFSLMAFASMMLISLLFPCYAHAGIVEEANSIVQGWMRGWAESFMNSAVDVANIFGMDDALNAPFTKITTGGTSESAAYGVVKGIEATVKIVGQSILAFALLMQLVKISQRVDASATIPVVKEILILAVFFFIFSYLINHSFEICNAAYDEVNKIITSLIGSGNGTRSEIAKIQISDEVDFTVDGLIVVLLFSLLMWIVNVIATVVAYALVLARALQLYIMAACSPIPFSLMAFDETRQLGIGFCKNFVSVCLAGLILTAIVLCYPAIVSDVLVAWTPTSNIVDGHIMITQATLAGAIVPFLGASVMYLFALLKSGAWARDILGG